MKKIFTLCLSLMAGVVAVSAQDAAEVDDVFQFTNPEGVVYPDGSVLTFNEVTATPAGSTIYSDLYITNTSETTGGTIIITCDVKEISNGQFQICFPQNCVSLTSVGTLTTPATGGPIGFSQDLMTEFIAYGENASCTVTYHVERGTLTGSTTYPGSTITVTYTTDTSSNIAGVTVNGAGEEVARYTLDGRRLTAPQQGINIVKYADGRTVKVLVK